MLKRFLGILLVLLLGSALLSGCYTMGKGTGEVAEEVEEGAESFEKGYEEGKN